MKLTNASTLAAKHLTGAKDSDVEVGARTWEHERPSLYHVRRVSIFVSLSTSWCSLGRRLNPIL